MNGKPDALEGARPVWGEEAGRRFDRALSLTPRPSVTGPNGRRKKKTYLIAFMDDATRVITHAQFAFAENTREFLPVFKVALQKRGLPQRIFVDNGANYRSHHFSIVCAKVGVALIHSKPFSPYADTFNMRSSARKAMSCLCWNLNTLCIINCREAQHR